MELIFQCLLARTPFILCLLLACCSSTLLACWLASRKYPKTSRRWATTNNPCRSLPASSTRNTRTSHTVASSPFASTCHSTRIAMPWWVNNAPPRPRRRRRTMKWTPSHRTPWAACAPRRVIRVSNVSVRVVPLSHQVNLQAEEAVEVVQVRMPQTQMGMGINSIAFWKPSWPWLVPTLAARHRTRCSMLPAKCWTWWRRVLRVRCAHRPMCAGCTPIARSSRRFSRLWGRLCENLIDEWLRFFWSFLFLKTWSDGLTFDFVFWRFLFINADLMYSVEILFRRSSFLIANMNCVWLGSCYHCLRYRLDRVLRYLRKHNSLLAFLHMLRHSQNMQFFRLVLRKKPYDCFFSKSLELEWHTNFWLCLKNPAIYSRDSCDTLLHIWFCPVVCLKWFGWSV